MSEQMKKFEIVFSADDMKRFEVENEELLVDVHGMNCRQARMFIRNIVALMRGALTIDVIHGYTHGHAIKDMLRNERLSDRIVRAESVAWNPGMTRLIVA